MHLFLSEQLANCRRIFVSNYLALVNIGVYDYEKTQPQSMRFNIDLYVPIQYATSNNDDIQDVIDYEWLILKIKEVVYSKKHIHLQETLCDQLITTFLNDQRVSAVRVKCEKLNVCQQCEAIGVERFQFNTDAN